jgi:hypothetical protein
MLDLFIQLTIAAWFIWIFATCGIFALGLLFAEYPVPTFDGFRIHIPEAYRQHPKRELDAVIEHELGHKAHGHVWENLISLCLLNPTSCSRRVEQELEADDWVKDSRALADFLRRSEHPFDHYRASRLYARSQSSTPTSGMLGNHH